MTSGGAGSQGENTGVDNEWKGEEDLLVFLESLPFMYCDEC